jgi:alpha,alpha-trehalase
VFLLGGFLLALAWTQQGDAVAAARWFERNRASCRPPGLLAEEFDVKQRQLCGNSSMPCSWNRGPSNTTVRPP